MRKKEEESDLSDEDEDDDDEGVSLTEKTSKTMFHKTNSRECAHFGSSAFIENPKNGDSEKNLH